MPEDLTVVRRQELSLTAPQQPKNAIRKMMQPIAIVRADANPMFW